MVAVHGAPAAGVDLNFLDTHEEEGGGEWCGHFVGTSFTFSDWASFETLAGDPRFYFDDASSAQAHGTSTEAWVGGAERWGGGTVTLPLYGHPAGVGAPGLARDPDDLVQSAYRHLIESSGIWDSLKEILKDLDTPIQDRHVLDR